MRPPAQAHEAMLGHPLDHSRATSGSPATRRYSTCWPRLGKRLCKKTRISNSERCHNLGQYELRSERKRTPSDDGARPIRSQHPCRPQKRNAASATATLEGLGQRAVLCSFGSGGSVAWRVRVFSRSPSASRSERGLPVRTRIVGRILIAPWKSSAGKKGICTVRRIWCSASLGSGGAPATSTSVPAEAGGAFVPLSWTGIPFSIVGRGPIRNIFLPRPVKSWKSDRPASRPGFARFGPKIKVAGSRSRLWNAKGPLNNIGRK